MKTHHRKNAVGMKRITLTILLVFVGLNFCGCGEVVSVGGLVPENPGDGDGEQSNSLMLSWTAPTTNEDGSPLDDLAGYRLYYGNREGEYSNVVDVGNFTTVELSELSAGTWYLTVTAYDYFGNESKYSNEINHTFL
jgi:hypothetical protein